jgi:serine phosphatase RsbU (regulator of sigma subunit)
MSPSHVRKVAGSEPPTSAQAHSDAAAAIAASSTAAAASPVSAVPVPSAPGDRSSLLPARGTPAHNLAVQDRLAAWVCDLSLLHELTERLARTAVLDDALHEVLRAGATLVGARRGLIALEPEDGLGPDTSVGLGLGRSDLGTLETVPHETPHAGSPRTPGRRQDSSTPSSPGGDPAYGHPAYADPAYDGPASGAGPDGPNDAGGPDGPAGSPGNSEPADPVETVHRDLLHEPGLTPRHREVAAQLGLAASYALPIAAESGGRLGTAVWFYDEPAVPADRQRRLAGLYARFAAEHLARCLDLSRARGVTAALAGELLPARLPRVSGVRMAVRHTTGPRGGGDWYDALPLPEGALGLAVGGVTGAGPGAVAAMGRLRASLRAYAVMEGEDPVAVLADLELLLRLTEPARSATALFAYATALPGGGRKLSMAGAGHCPPLIVGDRRCEFVETSLSAPLNMLSCWEAPGAELTAQPGESLLLYTDGLLHRTGEPADRAFARLHAAAQSASGAVREDPEQLADHVLRTLLPDGLDRVDSVEDLVLLAVRFD